MGRNLSGNPKKAVGSSHHGYKNSLYNGCGNFNYPRLGSVSK